jgi:hypothetical protein
MSVARLGGRACAPQQEVLSVATVPAYYSISPEDPEVYHDKDRCPDGERIKPENKRYGTDGRRKCLECPKVS